MKFSPPSCVFSQCVFVGFDSLRDSFLTFNEARGNPAPCGAVARGSSGRADTCFSLCTHTLHYYPLQNEGLFCSVPVQPGSRDSCGAANLQHRVVSSWRRRRHNLPAERPALQRPRCSKRRGHMHVQLAGPILAQSDATVYRHQFRGLYSERMHRIEH